MATEISESPIVALRLFPHAGVGARRQGCGHGARKGRWTTYRACSRLAFGAVVVLTMFAAETFDPRLIWDPIENRIEEGRG